MLVKGVMNRTFFLFAVLLHIADGLQTSTVLFQHYWDSRWMILVRILLDRFVHELRLILHMAAGNAGTEILRSIRHHVFGKSL
jgi:hypothetical protein